MQLSNRSDIFNNKGDETERKPNFQIPIFQTFQSKDKSKEQEREKEKEIQNPYPSQTFIRPQLTRHHSLKMQALLKNHIVRAKNVNTFLKATTLKPEVSKTPYWNLYLNFRKFIDRAKNFSSLYRYKALNMFQFSLINDRAAEPPMDISSANERPRHVKIFILILSFLYKILFPERILNLIPRINPLSKGKLIWDIFVLVGILTNAFTFSLELTFSEVSQDNQVSEYIKKGFLFVYIVDIMLKFSTGYYHRGELVMQRKKIFWNYIQFEFLIDVVSITGFFIDQGLIMIICKFFFCLKVYTIRKTFLLLEEILLFNNQWEGIFTFFKLIGIFLSIVHSFACLWHLAGSSQAAPDSWMNRRGIREYDWINRYINSFYWSTTTILTVGYGDITPVSQPELVVAMIAMIFGCVFTGYMISSIGFTLEKIYKKQKDLSVNLKLLSNYTKSNKIDYDLQVRLKKYYQYLWEFEEDDAVEKEQSILKRLSHNLREEVIMQTRGRILDNFPIFKKNFSPEALRKMSHAMKKMRCAPNDIIFEEGSYESNNLFFVMNGEVELKFSQRKVLSNVPLCIKKHGDIFGENTFFSNFPRPYTAKSLSFTTLYYLNRDEFLKILEHYPLDYEIFSYIKDNILLYGNTNFLYNPCLSCKSKSHDVSDCPMVFHIPNRSNLLQKHIYSEDQVRKKRERKRKRLHFLIIEKTPPNSGRGRLLSCQLEEDEQSSSLSQNESQKSEIFNEKLPLPDQPLYRSKASYSNEKEREENEEEAPVTARSNKTNNISNNQRSKSAKFQELENIKEMFHKLKEDLDKSYNNERSLEKIPDLQEDFMKTDWLDYDHLRNFTHYFPYNNSSNVIEFSILRARAARPLRKPQTGQIKRNSTASTLPTARRPYIVFQGLVSHYYSNLTNVVPFYLKEEPEKGVEKRKSKKRRRTTLKASRKMVKSLSYLRFLKLK